MCCDVWLLLFICILLQVEKHRSLCTELQVKNKVYLYLIFEICTKTATYNSKTKGQDQTDFGACRMELVDNPDSVFAINVSSSSSLNL